MNPIKTPIPEQDPKKRVANFKEVALGYTEEDAYKEANRCLHCKNPQCVKGCPVGIDIPGFIKEIKEKKPSQALKVLLKYNLLPGICGRVCPQETQCELKCILSIKQDPVGIGRLERYAADHGGKKEIPKIKPIGKTAAMVGSGPASLTCAAELAKSGFKVTIYEALHKPGGVLVYGIPEFRLPKKIVEEEIDHIKKLGVEIKFNQLVGRTITLGELRKQYDFVFIGTGAGLPYFMNIPGETLNRVYSANEYLTRVNLMKAYKFPEYKTPVKIGTNVVVVGGGNVAMDSARVARRLGSKVTVVYRRSEQEMPARKEEVGHAKEEGIIFKFLTNPTQILGKESVEEIECIQMELGEPDSSGRRRPVPVKGSEFKLKTDLVIMAIGQGSNPLIAHTTPELKFNKWGNVIVDDKQKTSLDNVYAGGDIVRGGATVIEAMGDGKKAGESMIALYNWEMKCRG